MNNRRQQLIAVFLFTLSFFSSTFVLAETEAQEIGTVLSARGAVSAKSPSGEIRVLGKDSAILQGDVISTGPKSFAVLKMVDDAQFSVRPDSVLSFEEYSMKENEESAAMRLFKGGLRSISGLIGKKKPDAFKLNTTVATIGIRGTDFDARLCEADCSVENAETQKKNNAVAKVAFKRGKINAVSKDNQQRELKLKSDLFEGDKIITGKKAYAVIVFNDESKMTLKAETEVVIEKHHFVTPESDENGATYKLIKGGIRALTGLISKIKKDNYKLKTPSATIGIRGTGFDVVWLGSCSGGAASCGLNVAVWKGSIFARNEAGEFVLVQNQSFLIPFNSAAATFTTTPPVFNIPRPDQVNVNFKELFGDNNVPLGLYTNIRDGKVFMKRGSQIIELVPGEGGFVSTDGSVFVKLETPMSFQTNDPYLNAASQDINFLFNQLNNGPFQQNQFECVL